MNALRFQPIYVTLPPVSLQAVLLEDHSGRGAGLAHPPFILEARGQGRTPWESPRSVLAVTDRPIGKKSGRSRCGFFSAWFCSIPILQCHLQGTKAL